MPDQHPAGFVADHPAGFVPDAAPATPQTGTQFQQSLKQSGAIKPPEGFFQGLMGGFHPIDSAKELYQNLKENPLKTVLGIVGSEAKTAAGAAAVFDPSIMGHPQQAVQDVTAAQQQNPNAGAAPFQMAQAQMGTLAGSVLPVGDIATTAAKGETAKAIGQGTGAALGLISMMPEESILAGKPAITRGVAPGASKTAEWLESKLTKFPTGGPLERAYAQNQTLLRATMANAVADAANQTLPQELFDTIEKDGKTMAYPKGEGLAAKYDLSPREASAPGLVSFQDAKTGGSVEMKEGFTEDELADKLTKSRAAMANTELSDVAKAKQASAAKPPEGLEVDVTGRPVLNLNPDEIVDNFQKGSNSLRMQARANYKAADAYVDKNTQGIIKNLMNSIPREQAGFIATADILDHPIEGLKSSIAKLNMQGERLMNSGQGIQAHQLFQQADSLSGVLDGIKAKLPPDVQNNLAAGDKLWANKSALEDIAEVLKEPSVVSGAPPSAQNPLTGTKQQAVGGAKLLREATLGDKAYRFQQVFGPDTTRQITDLADLIGKQQAMKGAGTQGMGGMMLGSGMLLGALRGGVTGAATPLIGLDLLTRVMASPDNWTLFKNMLKANPKVAAGVIAPRIIENMRQQGQLPEYLYEQRQAQQPVQQVPAPPATGASIGDQLKSKGIQIPQAQPNTPGMPFHPGAGL